MDAGAPDLAAPIVVLTGAGVSTDSGIPDFRSRGGVWDKFDPAEFTIDRFHADPDTFWARRARLIAAMDYLNAEPNEAHNVLARAVADGRIALLITQNVDGLHAKAGTPADRLVEVHGNGRWSMCTGCGRRYPVEEALARQQDGRAPRCDCHGILKPGVVLFGEPVEHIGTAMRAVADCATLVVAGTSLTVWPVAGLAAQALDQGAALVICNRDPTPFDDAATIHRGPVSQSLARLFPSPAR